MSMCMACGQEHDAIARVRADERALLARVERTEARVAELEAQLRTLIEAARRYVSAVRAWGEAHVCHEYASMEEQDASAKANLNRMAARDALEDALAKTLR